MSAAAAAFPSPRLLLCGLDDKLRCELEEVLAGFEASNRPVVPSDTAECARVFRDCRAQVVFGPSEPETLRTLLEAAGLEHLPVIAVSRNPDVREWLDAIEAGAADYTAPPFETGVLRWMVNVNVRWLSRSGS